MSSGWRSVQLGDACTIKYGKALPESARSGGETPVYGSNGIVGHHDSAITAGKTIVIGRKGSFGEVNYSEVPCWPIDTAYFIDESSTDQDIRWLGYRLSCLGLNKLNKAAAVPGLNRDDAYRQELLLPPLSEQRRIAAILDQADALRAKRREALAQLDKLAQAIFVEMFGDPTANPMCWPDPTLGGALSDMQYGPRFHNETYVQSGVRIVRITDLNELGQLNFNSMPKLAVDESAINQYSLRAGDVIFARTGATVGKAAIIQEEDPLCIAGAYFIRMRFVEHVLPEYAFAVLMTKSVKTLVTVQSRQAAQQNFSGPGLRRLPMPTPPLELQQKFAKRVSAIQAQQKTHQVSLAELEALFASLQHRAFRGEL